MEELAAHIYFKMETIEMAELKSIELVEERIGSDRILYAFSGRAKSSD